MPKSTQVSMQFTGATQRQVEELTALGFGNRTDIVRIAVDRMHREETLKMEKITHVRRRAPATAGL